MIDETTQATIHDAAELIANHYCHEEDVFKAEVERLERGILLLIDTPRLGPTGQYPQGHFGAADEGELQFGVAVKGGKVLIDFGKPIAWLAMDHALADQLGDTLKRRAAQVRASLS